MLYLLDTNTLSDFIRNPDGAAARRAAREAPETLCTSIVAAAEMWFGAVKRNSATLPLKLAALFEWIRVMPLGPPAEHTYAECRANLERRGLPISANDMLIAAHALTLDATLVTGNEREFSRIEGLKIENWLH